MSFAHVYSAQNVYLSATRVTIEADVSRGLHSFQVVGLPDRAIDESRERVAAAIKNSGFPSPKHSNQRVLVSLAPADLKKEGPSFDLPIALSYLLATQVCSFSPANILFLGELSLQGDLRPVRGVLSIAQFAAQNGFHTLIVPRENAVEAALVHDITVYGADTLAQVVEHLTSADKKIEPQVATAIHTETLQDSGGIDLADVRGQETAKRGLEIAAAGRHNIVLFGPPGTGKTMLARAFRGILPPLSVAEALEVTAVHSLTTPGGLVIGHPPFRAPHHTSSHASIVGGGSIPRPGEITLAHRGVLFMDEFPEFDRRVIDALREPLEDRVVSIARARGSATFPANFILVAAMNPNRERGVGQLSEIDREHLKRKISGPVVDRIDMWIEVSHIDHEKLSVPTSGVATSAEVRGRIVAARARQAKRFSHEVKTNADMTVRDIDTHIALKPSARTVLQTAAQRHNLSPRSYHRTIKLAQTIADLAGEEDITEMHVLEALTYRPRELFG